MTGIFRYRLPDSTQTCAILSNYIEPIIDGQLIVSDTDHGISQHYTRSHDRQAGQKWSPVGECLPRFPVTPVSGFSTRIVGSNMEGTRLPGLLKDEREAQVGIGERK